MSFYLKYIRIVAPAGLLLFMVNCTPSAVLFKEYALYNFTEEGFLSRDMAQTIASEKYPVGTPGKQGARRMCLQQAKEQARQRMLSIFLHTYFDIPPSNRGKKGSDNTFKEDYPLEFNDADYLRAEVDFMDLLDTGFIALQDTRNTEKCMVVFRVLQRNLPDRIRDVDLTFLPESLREEDRFMDHPRFYME